jgi:hypothetical protein
MGHATMENRHGLAVAGMVTHANGTAERRAAEIMLKARSKAAGHRITAGEDKAYDTADHVTTLRATKVTPHVTQNNGITKTGRARKSAIDERTTRHQGYPFGVTTVINHLCMSFLLVLVAQCTYVGLSAGEYALTVKPGFMGIDGLPNSCMTPVPSSTYASGPNLTLRFGWGFPEGLACASLGHAQANEYPVEPSRP